MARDAGGAGPEPMRHRAMRGHNLAVVLGEVARQGVVSRAGIAVATGLTRSSVSTFAGELVAARLLVADEPSRDGERGRPAVGLRLHGDHVAGLGAEIGVDRLAVAVLDLQHRVRVRLERSGSNRRPPARVFGDLRELVADAADRARTEGLTVAGATVAVPGVLDPATARLVAAPNLGWHDVALRGHVDGLLRDAPWPARADNEANAAAWGEARLGAAREHASFMLVTGEVGIGAGLVIGSRPFAGADGYAGELGHVVVAPGGRRCACGGRGCLETVAGLPALLRAARLRPDAGLPGLLASLARGRPAAVAAVDAAASALALALSAAVNLVAPGVVVLGGTLAALGDHLLPRLEAELAAQVGGLRGAAPAVLVSALGADAAVLGGAVRVLDAVVADPARLLP